MNRDETVQQAIEALLVKTDTHSDAHPNADTLVAYQEGTLAPGDMQRVQDHLVACRECAALVADLEGLGDPDFGADEDLPDDAGEIVWKKVREEIRRDRPRPGKVLPLPGHRDRSPRWLQALAASLLAATVGLSLWVADLKRPQPQLNAPIYDLYPAGSIRGEGGNDLQAVPAEARDILLILHPPGRSRFEEHGIEIVDAGGREVWRSERGLVLNPDGSFTLSLPRDFLGHRLRLMGIDPGGGRELVAEYALPVEQP